MSYEPLRRVTAAAGSPRKWVFTVLPLTVIVLSILCGILLVVLFTNFPSDPGEDGADSWASAVLGDRSLLPAGVAPIRYDVRLDLRRESGRPGDLHGHRVLLFPANVTIHLRSDQAVSHLILHGGCSGYRDIRLASSRGQVPITRFMSVSSNSQPTWLVMELRRQPVRPHTLYQLDIQYELPVLDDPAWPGLRQVSVPGAAKGERVLAADANQAGGARALFPCFDEPRFTAQFNVSVVHDWRDEAAFNTAPDPALSNDILTQFQPTVVTPTHLLNLLLAPTSRLHQLPVAFRAQSSSHAIQGSMYWIDDDREAMMNELGKELPKMMEQWRSFFGVELHQRVINFISLEPASSYLNMSSEEILKGTKCVFAKLWIGGLVSLSDITDKSVAEALTAYVCDLVIRPSPPEDQTWLLAYSRARLASSPLLPNLSSPDLATVSREVLIHRSLYRDKGWALMTAIEQLVGQQVMKDCIQTFVMTYQQQPQLSWHAFLRTLAICSQNEFPDKLGFSRHVSLPGLVEPYLVQPGIPVISVTMMPFVDDEGKVKYEYNVSKTQFSSMTGEDDGGRRWPIPVSYRPLSSGALSWDLMLEDSGGLVLISDHSDLIFNPSSSWPVIVMNNDMRLRHILDQAAQLSDVEQTTLGLDTCTLYAGGYGSAESLLLLVKSELPASTGDSPASRLLRDQLRNATLELLRYPLSYLTDREYVSWLVAVSRFPATPLLDSQTRLALAARICRSGTAAQCDKNLLKMACAVDVVSEDCDCCELVKKGNMSTSELGSHPLSQVSRLPVEELAAAAAVLTPRAMQKLAPRLLGAIEAGDAGAMNLVETVLRLNSRVNEMFGRCLVTQMAQAAADSGIARHQEEAARVLNMVFSTTVEIRENVRGALSLLGKPDTLLRLKRLQPRFIHTNSRQLEDWSRQLSAL